MSGRPARSSGSRSSQTSQPPKAELDVLGCLWQHKKATVREIREAMSGYRAMAHGSVVSLLKRLEARGLVRHEKGPVGKAFVYMATSRPEPTRKRLVSEMLQRIFGGNGVAMISTLLDTKPLTDEEREQLEKLIRDKSTERGSGEQS